MLRIVLSLRGQAWLSKPASSCSGDQSYINSSQGAWVEPLLCAEATESEDLIRGGVCVCARYVCARYVCVCVCVVCVQMVCVYACVCEVCVCEVRVCV